MDLQTFKNSLDRAAPPDDLGLPLQALWHLAKGDWDRAHSLAQAGIASRMAWGRMMLRMAVKRLIPMARAAII